MVLCEIQFNLDFFNFKMTIFQANLNYPVTKKCSNCHSRGFAEALGNMTPARPKFGHVYT